MIDKIKKNPVLFSAGLVLVILGIILIFIDKSWLMDFIFIIVGIITACTGLVIITSPYQSKLNSIFGILYIATGMVMIFYRHWLLSVILAVVLLIFPIYRIIVAQDHWLQFKKEIPLFIILVLVSTLGFDNVICYVVAGGFILFGAYLLYLVFSYKERKEINKRASVDVNFVEK